mmetsp:Transcript_58195/g.170166  ORF Transcript_58195/g.170166 Transcript_58195/m.170166 type:complete len:282 (-) Transcript_58195:643-1488(-)
MDRSVGRSSLIRAATTYSLSRLWASIRRTSESPLSRRSSSEPRASDIRQTPLKGGPPKNLEPVPSTILPLSRCLRTSLSPMRPWHASTTGRISLPYRATMRSRQATEGMHLPVLLPTTMCTRTQPYFGRPPSVSATASSTTSSTLRSRSSGESRRPNSSRMKRFRPVMMPVLGPCPMQAVLKMQPPSGLCPEGRRLAKSWPMDACRVPEPTSPAAVTMLKTWEPRPSEASALAIASSDGMSSASVPEGKRLMASSHESPKMDRSRSRTSQSSFLKRSSGEA